MENKPELIDPFSVPRVGVALFVVKDNSILLHKRLSKHAYGTWACPGGHLEKGETFIQAALRELEEEAGDILVTTPDFFTAINTVYPDENKHYVTVFLTCGFRDGVPKVMEPEKAERWEWFDWYKHVPSPLMQGIQRIRIEKLNPVLHHYTLLHTRFNNVR